MNPKSLDKNMSSKRKNTPTKLSKDEVLIQRERLENGSDGDSQDHSDCDSDSSLTLHIVSKPQRLLNNHSNSYMHNDDSDDASGSGSGSGSEQHPPRSKKARLLQSVRDSDGDSDGGGSHHYNTNNHLIPQLPLTKPMNGLLPQTNNHHNNHHHHRKSMDHVLRRLSSKAQSMSGDAAEVPRGGENGTSDSSDVMNSIKTVISTAESTEEKEKRLADMIAQLQSLKESISQQKSGSKSDGSCSPRTSGPSPAPSPSASVSSASSPLGIHPYFPAQTSPRLATSPHHHQVSPVSPPSSRTMLGSPNPHTEAPLNLTKPKPEINLINAAGMASHKPTGASSPSAETPSSGSPLLPPPAHAHHGHRSLLSPLPPPDLPAVMKRGPYPGFVSNPFAGLPSHTQPLASIPLMTVPSTVQSSVAPKTSTTASTHIKKKKVPTATLR